jgi:hypothetical protein
LRIRVGKLALLKRQRYAQAKQFKRAQRSLKTLKTFLGRVIRDIARRIKGNEALEKLFAHPLMLAAAPETVIAVAKHLIAAESNAPRRWFGFGGEVPILNAKAALLSARALRRDEGRRARPRAHDL